MLSLHIPGCARTLVLMLLFGPQPAQTEVVRVANTYHYAGGRRYDWSVFIKEDRSTLDKIRCVEYTLHPTFPNPVRRICTSQSGFALRENGWGEFTIYVRIEWKDSHATNQSYRLDLHSHPSSAAPQPTTSIRTGNTSTYLGNKQWSWTVFILGDGLTLDGIQCVEYTLHPTFPKPIQRVCVRGDHPNQAFPLSATGWGTFDVGIKILFRDGRALFLKHALRFDAGQS